MNTYEMSQFLVEQRKKNNFTQKDIAELCNVSTQAVSKWERGDSVPDILILEKLSKLYDKTINEIINGKAENQKYQVNKNYIISLTASVLVFFAYLMNFVKLYIGQIDVIFKGFDLVFNGTGGEIVVISWLVFIVLVSYLLINIFLITKVIAINKSLNVYVTISGSITILLTMIVIITGGYILLPHLIIITSVIVQMICIGIKIEKIKRTFDTFINDETRTMDKKIYNALYFSMSILAHILIIVGTLIFFLTDVYTSDIASMIIVPISWGLLVFATYKLVRNINKNPRKQLLVFMGLLILSMIGFGMVNAAMGYDSVNGVLLIQAIYLLTTILYLISTTMKPKKG